MKLDERNGAVARIVRSTWEKAIRPVSVGYVATLLAMFSGLNLAGWLLFLGAIGQGCLYYRLFPALPAALVMVPVLIPWLIVFFLSYFKQVPFGPRPFRYCLIFAGCWYLVLTLLAEALNAILKPLPHDFILDTVARLLTYIGALSLVILARTSILIRRYETTEGAHSPSESPDRYPNVQSGESLALPCQYSYNPRWFVIVCGLGAGLAVLFLMETQSNVRFGRLVLLFGFALIFVASLTAIRRIGFKRELLLDIDALTLPTGPFQMRNARIVYSSIQEVWLVELPLTQVICFSTQQGRFEIPSTMLPEKDSFIAIWKFLHLQVQYNRTV